MLDGYSIMMLDKTEVVGFAMGFFRQYDDVVGYTLDEIIEKAKAEVLSIENKKVLRSVLQKARKIVEKQQWTKDQEVLKRWRDRRNNADAIKKYRTRLKKDVDEMTNWVLHPNNKDVVKHIPEVLKDSVIPFLSSVDFTSKRQLRGGEATKRKYMFKKGRER